MKFLNQGFSAMLSGMFAITKASDSFRNAVFFPAVVKQQSSCDSMLGLLLLLMSLDAEVQCLQR